MAATRFDSWLTLIFLSRSVMYANFMAYAACLPVLLNKWDMSATQAGSISSVFMVGYAVSLFVFAWLSDRFGAKRLFLLSAVLSALSALVFGFFARSYLTGLVLSCYALRKTTNNIHPRVERLRVTAILRRNRNARLLIAGYSFHCWELLGMWSWTPAFFAAILAFSGNGFGETAQFGAYLVAARHIVGALASVSMGRLADQFGRRIVLILVAASGACVSLVIGWLITWPITLLVCLGLVYYFFAIGDSPVLSTALTEAVEPGYLGSTASPSGH